MEPEELRQRIDDIIAIGDVRQDDEAAHIEEDKLHLYLIHRFCPEWVQAEVNRLTQADFCRWYA